MRQLTLLAEINRLINCQSQFIIAPHSPILLAYPSATIYEFDQHGIKKVSYEETEHYQVTRHFLNHPEQILRHLLVANPRQQ
jgi:predicted ATPase